MTNTITNTVPNTKFLYLQDPKNSGRVITVARHVAPTSRVVSFAFAICQPSCDSTGMPIRMGDRFTKKLGREISEGRLANLLFANHAGNFAGTAKLDTDRPIRAILNVLARDPRVIVSRCAQAALDAHIGDDATTAA